MYLEGIEKRTQEMVLAYKIIYKIVIRYGIFFLILAGAIYRGQTIMSKETNIISLNDITAAEKELQIKKFKHGIDIIKGSGELTVFVGLGSLKEDGSLLASYNNLASYNGFTLPRYFNGDTTLLEDKNKLEGEMESTGDLEAFMTNVLSIKDKDSILKERHQPIPIEENTVTTFNLQCLSQSKIYNGLCEMFTDNFIETFLLYNIETDIEGFKKIFVKLIDKDRGEYKDRICKNLIYHVYYTENIGDELKGIIKLCPTNYYDTFNKFALYYEIQKELEEKKMSTTIYPDKIINEYKIRSFLQILYEEVESKTINLDRVKNYLDIVEELLKEEKISKLDANMIYYFNNHQLKQQIQNPELIIKGETKGDLDTLLKRLNNINNGSFLIGYKGLNTLISESIIIKDNDDAEVESGTIKNDSNTLIEKLLNQISNFSIENKQLSGNQVLTKGILKVVEELEEGVIKTIKLPIKARFEEQSSVLFIKKIEIIGEDEFNNNVNAIIEGQQRSFGDFQQYLNENKNSLSAINEGAVASGVLEKEFCEQAERAISNIAFLERCNDSTIGASFSAKDGTKVGISINYKDFIFKNLEVSDSKIKEQISKYLNRPETITKYQTINATNLIEFLMDLINLIKNPEGSGILEEEDFTASNNTILVIENIKKYLGVTVTDIVEKDGRTAVTFTLGGVNFIANYNISTHTIEQVYFKDIKIDDVPAIIKNSQIVLDDNNLEEIRLLRKDPIAYFNSKSIENQLLYLKYGKK